MAQREPRPTTQERAAPADAAAALPAEEGQVPPDVGAGPIELLRAELEEARDRELRARAELDNYRKRAARQMDEERRYAGLPLLRDLLPVLDNLKRALEAAEKTRDAESLLEGVRLVVKQFYAALERHHCVPIESLHEPFNPNVHEAVYQQPSDEFPANTVLHEVQAGFQLHDRVVRPSQVVVTAAVAEPKAPSSHGDPPR